MHERAMRPPQTKRSENQVQTARSRDAKPSPAIAAAPGPRGANLMVLQGVLNGAPRSSELTAYREMANRNAEARGPAALQRAAASPPREAAAPAPVATHHSGLPGRLKAGVESLSGMSMNHVRVHYNSPQPAQLQAYAFARGSNIHLGPGQEKHLPHEAWHVVQQAQGRVRPTLQMAAGVALNADTSLEREADRMGAQAMLAGASSANGGAAAPPAPLGGQPTVQLQSHGLVGTMIHHAPPAQDLPAIDQVNRQFYTVLSSRRGEIQKNSTDEYEWDFATLASKLARMRKKTGLKPGLFPIIINANRMVSPGDERSPRPYMDEAKAVFAFGSVWGMNFLTPEKSAGDYESVLEAWEKVPNENAPRHAKKAPLGTAAKSLLRDHAKGLVAASRNDAIPHRGLRNLIVSDPEFIESLEKIEQEADFVHIVTLDSDVDLGGGEIFKEIGMLAEEHLTGKDHPKDGIHITATDYVYARDNVFEWFAGALDKAGRKKLEENGVDAYPAEPGLTISYASEFGDTARDFIRSEPFGPEYSGDPREGPFKDVVDSRQSVEGKNLRQKWRNTTGKQNAQIHRTVSYLTVNESQEQKKGHPQKLKAIMFLYNKKQPITPDLIQSLITSDTYHSLAKDRNNDEKIEHQKKIVFDATQILNKVIAEHEYPQDPNELKSALNDALSNYLDS